MVATTTPPPISHLDPEASVFPAEVCERIIDYLAYQALLNELVPKPSALVSCCLTSRWWFPRSRYHLYFELVLDSRERFESLSRCLDVNPTNSLFVRKLVVLPFYGQGWVSAVPLTLAPKLKNLLMFQVCNVELTSLHPSFSQHLAIFSTVPELELRGEGFRGPSFTQMILAFPHLQKLRISVSRHSTSSRDEAAVLAIARRKGPLPLRHLSLYDYTAPLLLPALVASATPLTTLDYIIASGASTQDIERGLQSLGLFLSSCDTLRSLWLTVPGLNGPAVCSHISFSSLPNLHHLRFYTYVKEAEDITAVAELLSTISVRSLQFLRLRLDVSANSKILDTPAPWGMLNESLLRPHVHSTREISTSIVTKGAIYASEEEVLRLLPAMKSVNVVNHWLDSNYEEIWAKL